MSVELASSEHSFDTVGSDVLDTLELAAKDFAEIDFARESWEEHVTLLKQSDISSLSLNLSQTIADYALHYAQQTSPNIILYNNHGRIEDVFGSFVNPGFESLQRWYQLIYKLRSNVLGVLQTKALEDTVDIEEAKKLVLAAMDKTNCMWRSQQGLINETGLSEHQVSKALSELSNKIVRSSRTTTGGRALFASRIRYRREARLTEKLLGVLKNRID